MPRRTYQVLEQRDDEISRWAVWVTVYPMPPKRAAPGVVFNVKAHAEAVAEALQDGFDQGVAHGRNQPRPTAPGTELTRIRDA